MSPKIDRAKKSSIFHRVRDHMLTHWGFASKHMCLYWSFYTLAVLKQEGIAACLQAGDCFWPAVSLEDWDREDIPFTRFGYQWNEPLGVLPEMAEIAAESGILPEIHVWVGIVDEQEVVDFTTGFWESNFSAMCTYGWTAESPPAFLWANYDDMPDRVMYHPLQQATIFAAMVLRCLAEKGKLPLL